jgi:hypothetical protein
MAKQMDAVRVRALGWLKQRRAHRDLCVKAGFPAAAGEIRRGIYNQWQGGAWEKLTGLDIPLSAARIRACLLTAFASVGIVDGPDEGSCEYCPAEGGGCMVCRNACGV